MASTKSPDGGVACCDAADDDDRRELYATHGVSGERENCSPFACTQHCVFGGCFSRVAFHFSIHHGQPHRHYEALCQTLNTLGLMDILVFLQLLIHKLMINWIVSERTSAPLTLHCPQFTLATYTTDGSVYLPGEYYDDDNN